MQTEVDMEAEEEARRLEHEIAASRIEREKRRANNRRSAEPPEQTKSSVAARTFEENKASDLTNIADRQRDQKEAFIKLHEEEATSATPSTRPTMSIKASSMPTSLASIIGGTATGPRLNKHAPQTNAHDPSQFAASQRSDGPSATARLIGVSSGVPLPGLQGSSNSASAGPSSRSSASQTPIQSTPSRPSPLTISSAMTALQNIDSGSLPQTPKSATSVIPISAPQQFIPPLAAVSSPIPPLKPSTKPSIPVGPAYFRAGETKQAPQPISPPRVAQPPSLARPVQPSPSTPQLPISQSVKASPAFLRALPPKDLTPSLTRLQGRGIVSQRVQLAGSTPTSQISSLSKSGGISPSSGGSGRKLDVLSRWPAASVSPNPGTDSRPKATASPGPNKISFNGFVKSTPPATPPPSLPSSTSAALPSTPPIASVSTPQAPPTLPTLSRQTSPGMVFALPGLSTGKSGPTMPRNQHVTSTEQGWPAPRAMAFALPGMALGKAPPSVPQDDEPSSSQAASQDSPGSTVNQPAHLTHLTRDRARKPRKTQGSALRATPAGPSEVAPNAIPVTESQTIANSTAAFRTAMSISPNSKLQHNLGEDKVTASPPHVLSQPPVFLTATDRPSLESFGPSTAEEVLMTTPSTKESAGLNASVSQAGEALETGLSEMHSSSPVRVRTLPGLSTVDTSFIASDGAGTSRRRTVMEIAQGMSALSMAQDAPPNVESVLTSEAPEEQTPPKVDVRSAIASWGKPAASVTAERHEGSPEITPKREPPVDVRTAVASWARSDTKEPSNMPQISKPPSGPIPRTASPSQRDPVKAERRRSNLHDKYASMILPSLVEEKTPAPTPFGSIARRDGSATTMVDDTETEAQVLPTEAPKRPPSAFIMHQALLEHKALIEVTEPSPAPSPAPFDTTELLPEPAEDLVEISVSSDPANRHFDINDLPHSERRLVLPPNSETISVEVLQVTGKLASAVSTDPHIFYDVEVRAIVHRYKSGGLVSMRVYGWRGRQAEVGPSEAKKLGELATRFGTSLIPCIQGSEPNELVTLLGGVLITRQGPGAHWTKDNTSMHCVRAVNDVVFIDQVEPDRKNLCSAFSYVATLLDNVYIFHGKGATAPERSEATKYALSLLSDGASPIEFEEGAEDEMFSMILGDDTHAMADFWKYRSVGGKRAADLFRIDAQADAPVQRLDEVAAESIDPSAVFVLDGVFEVFVIVGADARQQRQDIHLGLSVARQLGTHHAPMLPFDPPVHVLILPSQVPLDLRVGHVRYMDDYLLNGGEIPDHMNLISAQEATEQLSRTSWPKSMLNDLAFLPLGVSPDDLPELVI
ncbi:hypothetical protein FRB96_008828 [Tulasnella sp. 330]|nr:hypothetical protein FRB96_008828 [Tulasnella sp. 330]